MSFTTSLLIVLTVVVVLLTFGFAAHQRTLAELVEIVNRRPPGGSWYGAAGRRGGLAPGERLALPVPPHEGRSVVVFASPGCADGHEILGRLHDQLAATGNGARLVSVWTGAAPEWARRDPSVVVVEEPGLVDDLGVVRTPAVAVLDGDVVVESAATARADVAVKLVQRQLDGRNPSQEEPGWE
jgi:hypothetical protein